MKIAKYFWQLNEEALKETEKIIKNPAHSKYPMRMVELLSRCDQPKELFKLISKRSFVESWPKIRSYWKKIEKESEFRDWWQTLYEQIIERVKQKSKKPKIVTSVLFLKVGRKIREARISKGLSQSELAIRLSMKQPDISKIEEGKKNLTLATLARLCKVLDIQNINLM